MTIKELKRQILKALYRRYKDDGINTSIQSDELAKSYSFIFDSPGQYSDALKLLRTEGFINATFMIDGSAIIIEITPQGIEYVEDNFITNEEAIIDGLEDSTKAMKTGRFRLDIDNPNEDNMLSDGTEKDYKSSGSSSRSEKRKTVKLFDTQANYKPIVGDNVTPCFGVDVLVECYAQQMDKISQSDIDSIAMMGVFGQWGRGKTYFCKHLKESLSQFKSESPICWEWKIPKYKFVDFNAWKYKETPALWAYVYETLYTRANFFERLLLFLKRFIKQLTPCVIVLGIAWLLGWLVSTHIQVEKIKEWFEALALPLTWLYSLLSIIYAFIKEPWSAVKDIKSHTQRKSYTSQLGIQNEIEKDLEDLLRILIKNPKKRKLVLFVEDIDRAEPSQMGRIIDSLRLILENEEIRKRLMVLCCIDINKFSDAYEQQCPAHLDEKQKHIYVTEYLDKIFLFGISLAKLDSSQQEEYLQHLISTASSESVIPVVPASGAVSTSRMKGSFIPTSPEQEPTTFGDTDIYNLMREYLKIHPGVSLTPRRIRIIYYRILMASNILAKSGLSITDAEVVRIIKSTVEGIKEENVEEALSDLIPTVAPY